jgi:hypothetical protein
MTVDIVVFLVVLLTTTVHNVLRLLILCVRSASFPRLVWVSCASLQIKLWWTAVCPASSSPAMHSCAIHCLLPPPVHHLRHRQPGQRPTSYHRPSKRAGTSRCCSPTSTALLQRQSTGELAAWCMPWSPRDRGVRRATAALCALMLHLKPWHGIGPMLFMPPRTVSERGTIRLNKSPHVVLVAQDPLLDDCSSSSIPLVAQRKLWLSLNGWSNRRSYGRASSTLSNVRRCLSLDGGVRALILHGTKR